MKLERSAKKSTSLRADRQLWAIFVVRLRAVHRGQSDWSKVPNKVKKELAEVSFRSHVSQLEADGKMASMVILAVDAGP